MIKVQSLEKKYGDFTALDELSFELKEGESLGLIGPNGAGKSTTIKMIIGLMPQTRGHILINNKKVTVNNTEIKKIIGYMPEESALYEDMDAVTFLNFFAELYDIHPTKAAKKIRELMHDLDLDNKLISDMSKGMKRKVLIARSLISDPKILVYDEPASGLDPETTRFIIDYIIKLKKKGKIILLTSHNLFHVEKVCDKIIMLKKGKVIFNDTISAIKSTKTYKVAYKDAEGNRKIVESNSTNEINDILKDILSKKATIIQFKEEERSLEDIFLELTESDSNKK